MPVHDMQPSGLGTAASEDAAQVLSTNILEVRLCFKIVML